MSRKQKRAARQSVNLEHDELLRNLAARDKAIEELSRQLILTRADRDMFKRSFEEADRERYELQCDVRRLNVDILWKNNAIKNLQSDLKDMKQK